MSKDLTASAWPFPHYPVGGVCLPPPPPRVIVRRSLGFGPWHIGRDVPVAPGVYQRVRAKMMKAYDYFDGECWRVGGETYAEATPSGRRSESQCVKWREVLP